MLGSGTDVDPAIEDAPPKGCTIDTLENRARDCVMYECLEGSSLRR